MPLDNQIADFFQKQRDNYSSAEANMGNSQGSWPPNGEHDVKITGITIRPMNFKLPNGTTRPAMSVSFGYVWLADADSPDGPGEDTPFRGSSSIMVDAFETITAPAGSDAETSKKWDGKQTQARIAMDRFKGQMTGLLGDEVSGDLVSDLTAAQELITNTEGVIIARVFCKHRENNGTVYKEDFIQQVLAK